MTNSKAYFTFTFTERITPLSTPPAPPTLTHQGRDGRRVKFKTALSFVRDPKHPFVLNTPTLEHKLNCNQELFKQNVLAFLNQ